MQVFLEAIEATPGAIKRIAAKHKVQRRLVGLDSLHDRRGAASRVAELLPILGQETIDGAPARDGVVVDAAAMCEARNGSTKTPSGTIRDLPRSPRCRTAPLLAPN